MSRVYPKLIIAQLDVVERHLGRLIQSLDKRPGALSGGSLGTELVIAELGSAADATRRAASLLGRYAKPGEGANWGLHRSWDLQGHADSFDAAAAVARGARAEPNSVTTSVPFMDEYRTMYEIRDDIATLFDELRPGRLAVS